MHYAVFTLGFTGLPLILKNPVFLYKKPTEVRGSSAKAVCRYRKSVRFREMFPEFRSAGFGISSVSGFFTSPNLS